MADKIEKLGIPVIDCNLKSISGLWQFIRLIWELRGKYKVDIIQTWLYHGDLLGGFLGAMGNVPVVWGLHNAYLDKKAKLTTKLVVKLCTFFSYIFPKRIISCSETAYKLHLTKGYADKFSVITNGFNVDKYAPNIEMRIKMRAQLQLGNKKVYGLIARFDPLKDHANFFQAAKLVADKHEDVVFLLCGKDIDVNNKALTQYIEKNNLQDKVLLLGMRSDVDKIMQAIDYCVSSSKSEAFPMVIGEAMASGVPCIVTDVGDSKVLVADSGWCVPKTDSAALGKAMLEAYGLSREEYAILSEKARSRIVDNYSLEKISEEYSECYRDMLGR